MPSRMADLGRQGCPEQCQDLYLIRATCYREFSYVTCFKYDVTDVNARILLRYLHMPYSA
jgi:hypothetical protein